MKHLVLMFDVDGVLAHFTLGYTKLLNSIAKSGPILTNDQVEEWDFDARLWPANVVRGAWEYIKQSDSFWYDLETLASSEDLLRVGSLQAQHDVYFTTSRPGKSSKIQTEMWLQKYNVFNPTVIVTNKKGEVAKVLGADYAIDDKAGNAIVIPYFSPKTRSYLLGAKYNQFDHAVVGAKVRRVSKLSDYLDAIEEQK